MLNLELDLGFRFEKVQFRFKVGPNSELNFILLLFNIKGIFTFNVFGYY